MLTLRYAQILQDVAGGLDTSKPGGLKTAAALSQEYDLESMMSVAYCTNNSPMRGGALSRADTVDRDEESGLRAVISAATYVCEYIVSCTNDVYYVMYVKSSCVSYDYVAYTSHKFLGMLVLDYFLHQI